MRNPSLHRSSPRFTPLSKSEPQLRWCLNTAGVSGLASKMAQPFSETDVRVSDNTDAPTTEAQVETPKVYRTMDNGHIRLLSIDKRLVDEYGWKFWVKGLNEYTLDEELEFQREHPITDVDVGQTVRSMVQFDYIMDFLTKLKRSVNPKYVVIETTLQNDTPVKIRCRTSLGDVLMYFAPAAYEA